MASTMRQAFLDSQNAFAVEKTKKTKFELMRLRKRLKKEKEEIRSLEKAKPMHRSDEKKLERINEWIVIKTERVDSLMKREAELKRYLD
jgi:hypothetical protein